MQLEHNLAHLVPEGTPGVPRPDGIGAPGSSQQWARQWYDTVSLKNFQLGRSMCSRKRVRESGTESALHKMGRPQSVTLPDLRITRRYTNRGGCLITANPELAWCGVPARPRPSIKEIPCLGGSRSGSRCTGRPHSMCSEAAISWASRREDQNGERLFMVSVPEGRIPPRYFVHGDTLHNTISQSAVIPRSCESRARIFKSPDNIIELDRRGVPSGSTKMDAEAWKMHGDKRINLSGYRPWIADRGGTAVADMRW